MIKNGRPEVDPSRRICANCQHYCIDIDPHSGWGVCDAALDGGMFTNHTKHGQYRAMHTNGRYYTTNACKVRFISNREEVE